MICFITAALSADGYIAKDSAHAAFWTSKEDKKRFIEITKRAGVVVMGLNTYKTLGKPLKGRVNIVYSPDPVVDAAAESNTVEMGSLEVTTKPPRELIRDLEARGFKEVAICGGSQIYSMFMESGVVSELYLTIEPIVFGSGLKLFNKDLHYQLTLKSFSQTGGGSLLLHYHVNHAGT